LHTQYLEQDKKHAGIILFLNSVIVSGTDTPFVAIDRDKIFKNNAKSGGIS